MKLAGAVPAAPGQQIQITPDASTNALVIVAPPSEFEVISQITEKLDIVRDQVLVEMLILEISDEKLRQLGVDWSTFDPASPGNVRGFAATNFGPRADFFERRGPGPVRRGLEVRRGLDQDRGDPQCDGDADRRQHPLDAAHPGLQPPQGQDRRRREPGLRDPVADHRDDRSLAADGDQELRLQGRGHHAGHHARTSARAARSAWNSSASSPS